MRVGESADTAIEHAIRCGELLAAQKAELKHGEFKPWIEENCEFGYEAAKKYMRVSRIQKGTAIPFSSLDEALGYDKPTHVSHNTGENEWYTPPEIIEAACAVMGGIEVEKYLAVDAEKRMTKRF